MRATEDGGVPGTQGAGRTGFLHLCPEHLQLSRLITGALRARNLNTIGEVLQFVQSEAFSGFSYRPELTASIRILSAATRGNETDWQLYWKLSGEVFHHLAADLPELRVLSAPSREFPVCRDTFGNAGAMLERAGYETFGQLADGLRAGIPEVRGMGQGKIQDFFERLQEMIGQIRQKGEAAVLQVEEDDVPSGAICLPPDVAALPVTVLHIGTKSQHLRSAGIATLGQLSEAWPLSYRDQNGIGPTTLALITARMQALLAAVTDEGRIDWEVYCNACALPLIPSAARPETGQAFLTMLPDILSEIADRLPDPVQAAILRGRLSKVPAERQSLEEIAQACDPPVTRERVRQKEAGLLRQLAGGLLWDSYGGLGLHFHPSFSRWWRLAADRFRDTQDIGFDEFVSGLAAAWEVDVPSVMAELPFILAVVTGEPGMPAGFRSAIRIPAVFYGDLSEDVRALSWRRFRIGKAASVVTELGLGTIGDFVEACRTGLITEAESTATRAARDHLEVLAACVSDAGALDWSGYRLKLGLEPLPAIPVAGPGAFLEELPAAIGQMLDRLVTPARAPDIFRLRTSWPARSRLTLERTAEKLQSHGPSVKREETVFLQQLNDILIGRDFSQVPFWLEETWLGFWREASEVYLQNPNDYEAFERSLAARWRISGNDRGLAVLWAVLSGYPKGRPSGPRKSRTPATDGTSISPGRIRLAGFRQIH